MLREMTERHKESIGLISDHLAKFHDDKDQDSLSCRFWELMWLMDEFKMEMEINWNHLLEIDKKKE